MDVRVLIRYFQKARQQGRFDRIEGRGQPLRQFVEERNPFIGREDFLLNRLVQRQGAAPPWVEIQQGASVPHDRPRATKSVIELETAVNNFRDVIRQSWTRRDARTETAMSSSNINVSVFAHFWLPQP